jgi:hypothetical protein
MFAGSTRSLSVVHSLHLKRVLVDEQRQDVLNPAAHLGLAHPDTDLLVDGAITNGTTWSPKPEGGTLGC